MAVRRFLSVVDIAVAALARLGISEKFVRFSMVGGLGLCWDTATVYALHRITGLYIAGTCGFLVSATANWAMNRLWTFRAHTHSAAHIQWLRFLVANAIGFVLNRGTFFVLISLFERCREAPIIPIVAGSLAGLGFNYFLSKRLVFC